MQSPVRVVSLWVLAVRSSFSAVQFVALQGLPRQLAAQGSDAFLGLRNHLSALSSRI